MPMAIAMETGSQVQGSKPQDPIAEDLDQESHPLPGFQMPHQLEHPGAEGGEGAGKANPQKPCPTGGWGAQQAADPDDKTSQGVGRQGAGQNPAEQSAWDGTDGHPCQSPGQSSVDRFQGGFLPSTSPI